MTPEGKASQAVRERASAWGIKLFRNNSGAYNAKQPPSAGTRWGLGNESKKLNKKLKSGDFVGWTPLVITQEMVGKTVAVFTNIEAKAEGFKPRDSYNENSREYGQDKFNKLVSEAGGLAGFATGDKDLDLLIKKYIDRMKKL